MAKCQDCDYPGDGRCSTCHGTGGETSLLDAFAESLVGDEQICKVCGGSGKCQTCGGTGGEEELDIFSDIFSDSDDTEHSASSDNSSYVGSRGDDGGSYSSGAKKDNGCLFGILFAVALFAIIMIAMPICIISVTENASQKHSKSLDFNGKTQHLQEWLSNNQYSIVSFGKYDYLDLQRQRNWSINLYSIWVIGWDGNYGYIFYSENDGYNWEIRWKGYGQNPILINIDPDAKTGWLVSKDPKTGTNSVLKTIDGGFVWETVLEELSFDPFLIQKQGDTRIVIYGEGGALFGPAIQTFDNGKTWK